MTQEMQKENESKLTFWEKIKYKKLLKKIEQKKKEWEKGENADKEALARALWKLVEQDNITLYTDNDELHTYETLKDEPLEELIKLMEEILEELRTTVGMTKEVGK